MPRKSKPQGNVPRRQHASREAEKTSPHEEMVTESSVPPSSFPTESTKSVPKVSNSSSLVSRFASFITLILVVLVFGFYSLSVLRTFLLPLFMAALIAMIFWPLFVKIRHWCGNRPTLAATLTTVAVLTMVLAPIAALFALAVHEANQALDGFRFDRVLTKTRELRVSLGIQKPFEAELGKIERSLRHLDGLINATPLTIDVTKQLDEDRAAMAEGAEQMRQTAHLVVDRMLDDLRSPSQLDRQAIQDQEFELTRFQHLLPTPTDDTKPPQPISRADKNAIARLLRIYTFPNDPLNYQKLRTVKDDTSASRSDTQTGETQNLNSVIPSPPTDVSQKDGPRLDIDEESPDGESGDGEFAEPVIPRLQLFFEAMHNIAGTSPLRREQLTEAQIAYDNFRTELFGGPILKWVVDLANPSDDQVDILLRRVRGNITGWIPSITGTATSLISKLLMGLGIMTIAMFYFFLDGPSMIQAFMHLSPLDDRYEKELLSEFDQVSRAVVVATLLSALAQGILAGIGFAVVGLQSIFLLTLLTAVLALVPFVGAAAVWLPCAAWLAFVDQRYGTAGFMLIYGFGVVSMADNFIKPWVLQGQSKLHPLLALLSVLGGVQALGPIGILVGPMVVSFLQVLLTMLEHEITTLGAAVDR